MVRTVQKLLSRTLSPAAFWRVKYFWWFVRVYILRGLIARVRKRVPLVEGSDDKFIERIRAVNTLVTTEMCRVMTQHGSDKGRFNHNYTTIYTEVFGGLRGSALRIFELGIGTNNAHLPSSMGSLGKPGASLRGWRELFPKAQIFGADVDRSILFSDNRIKTFYCDQLDSNAIRELWAHPEMRDGMDIIVDDGLHTFAANLSFLTGSLSHLRANGVYIVEDITDGDLKEWRDEMINLERNFPNYSFALVRPPAPSRPGDNNLLMVRRQV